MIQLPDPEKSFEFENGFYLSCDSSRIGKMLAHYELFKMAANVAGDIVECGIYKGVSFSRFATFRELLENVGGKKLVGFDIFGKFPETAFEPDKALRRKFMETAGEESISVDQMREVLKRKKLDRDVELIAGDITATVPEYLKKNPGMKISMLNLDVDIYEPSVTILEHFYPRISKGGVLILDDYGTFPGETKAVDDYFKGKDVKIQRFPFAKTPAYIIKE